MFKQYILYILRWQLSTFILAPVISLLSNYNAWIATSCGNFIGAIIFFWIDKFIFKSSIHYPIWEIQKEIKCVDCGKIAKGYRLVKTKNYDRIKDKNPQFRCEECSQSKLMKLKEDGVEYY